MGEDAPDSIFDPRLTSPEEGLFRYFPGSVLNFSAQPEQQK
jgi:hypothetical protein